jgi:hypothetical protein
VVVLLLGLHGVPYFLYDELGIPPQVLECVELRLHFSSYGVFPGIELLPSELLQWKVPLDEILLDGEGEERKLKLIAQ